MARFVAQADAAEARGDAREALRIIQTFPTMPDGGPLWLPNRVGLLRQLVELGDDVSPAAISRWLVAQAARHLTATTRRAHLRAMEAAVAARGGLLALPGGDALDRRVKVMDHDWLYRQLFVYEYDALQRFVDDRAAPDLIGRADRIGEWAQASLGAHLHDGQWVLGRRVPISDGEMFEGPPLPVPADVAEPIARDPEGWVEHLTAGCRRHGTTPRRDGSTAGINLEPADDWSVLSDAPGGW